MDAKGILMIMISNLISRLHDSKMLKTSEERALFMKLNEDISRCLGLLDKKEKDLITSKEDESIGFANLSSFKSELMTVYFVLIINVLEKSKEIYENDIKNNDKISEKQRAMFFTLYELISVISSSLYSQQRISAGGSGGSIGKIGAIPGWQSLYVGSVLKEKSEVKKKEDYNLEDLENLSEDEDEMEEHDEDIEED